MGVRTEFVASDPRIQQLPNAHRSNMDRARTCDDADRWSPNLTVADSVLAALQSDRGDIFGRQPGVRDASAPAA